MRLRMAMRIWLLPLVVAGAACRTTAATTEPPAAGPQVGDDAVRGLPGYHSEMVDAPVFGGQAFVMEAGDANAPAVVLVHGLGESGCRDWYPVLPALAARFHVVTFDLPGFGRSTHANELYSPERYTEFIHALMSRHLSGPFSLVGHSMGGAISLLYAARFPADVARLLLIDVAGVLHRKAYVNFAVSAGLDNLLGVFAGPIKDLATVAEESTSEALGPILPGGSPDPSIVLKSDVLRSTMLGSPTKIAALAVILENFAPAIDGVRSPTWILWGKNDAIASPRTGLVLRARVPGAQLRELDGSGHDPMATQPAAVVDFLVAALTSPASEPPPRVAVPFPSLPARKGRCERENGVQLTGDYAEIDITGCQDVVVKDVRTAMLRIRDSYATVESTRVWGQGIALEVKGSRVIITASDFAGKVAIETEGSDLDLAGVELRGQRAAVHVGGSSKLIFSVSRAESPINRRYLHGVYEFDIGVEL